MPFGTEVEKGRVSALVDGADLRYVAIDGVEVARRVHVTVRDAAWDTPPVTSLTADLAETADAIHVRATAAQRSGELAVTWRVAASIAADGGLRYSVVVRAEREFAFNRIGLCLLHPPDTCAGRPYRAVRGASETRGNLPRLIAPQMIRGEEIFALFDAFEELELEVGELGWCRLRFEGEQFEMEDQRNWSDGSFKTYCTPLSVGRPQRAGPGSTIEQAIVLSPPAPRRGRRGNSAGSIEIRIAAPARRVVPELGLGLGRPLSDIAARAIRALGPGHVRADLRRPDRFGAVLAQADRDAGLIGCPLVLALHLADRADEELELLEDRLQTTKARVIRVIAFSRQHRVSAGSLVERVRHQLAPLAPDAAFAGGTDLWFAELNRARPTTRGMDAVAWAVSPQVHGFDEGTMVEAIDAQADQAATARSFAGALDLLAGPITLRPRYNPHAPDAADQALDYPASATDPRQGSAFAAAWTAGSIRAQTVGGVRAATYYETAGPRGVIAGDGTDRVFPCGQVIALVARWRGWTVVTAASSRPLHAQALLVCAPDSAHLEGLVVNLTPDRRFVRLGPLAARGLALSCPGGANQTTVAVRDGRIELELAPWEVLRLRSC